MPKDLYVIIDSTTSISSSTESGAYDFYSLLNHDALHHDWVTLSKEELDSLHPHFSEVIKYTVKSGKQDQLLNMKLGLAFLQNKLEYLKLPGNYFRTKPYGIEKSKRAKDCYFIYCDQFNLVKTKSGVLVPQGDYDQKFLHHRSWLDTHYPGLALVIDQVHAMGVSDPVEVAKLAFEAVQTVYVPVDLTTITF